MSWLSDTLDGVFTGSGSGSTTSGGGGNIFSSVLPYVVQGGLSYLQSQNKAKADSATAAEGRQFESAEAEKARQFEKELLQLKLGAEAGGAGGGGSDIAAKQLLVNALQGRAQSELTGGQLKIQTLAEMLNAIQRGIGMVR